MDIKQMSSEDLSILIRKAAFELARRASLVSSQAIEESHINDGPSEQDRDFLETLHTLVRSGVYATSGDRARTAEIAAKYPDYVRRLGLPITHKTYEWRKLREAIITRKRGDA